MENILSGYAENLLLIILYKDMNLVELNKNKNNFASFITIYNFCGLSTGI